MNPFETPHAHLSNAPYYSSWNDRNPYEQSFTYASTLFNTLPALNVHSDFLPTFNTKIIVIFTRASSFVPSERPQSCRG